MIKGLTKKLINKYKGLSPESKFDVKATAAGGAIAGAGAASLTSSSSPSKLKKQLAKERGILNDPNVSEKHVKKAKENIKYILKLLKDY